MNERTHSWWREALNDFMKDEKYGCDMDGLWIDMNEPSIEMITHVLFVRFSCIY